MKKNRIPDTNYNEYTTIKDQVGVYRYGSPLPSEPNFNSYLNHYAAAARKPVQFNKDQHNPSAMDGRMMGNSSQSSIVGFPPYIYPPPYSILQNNSYYNHPSQSEVNMMPTSISPRREDSEKLANTLTSFQSLNPKDAFSYLDLVKMKYKNRPHIYNEFLDIMKEYKANKIDTTGVINSIQRLFESHPELIYAFKNFLPIGYYINDPLTGGKEIINTGIKNTAIAPSTNVDSAQSHSLIESENKPAYTLPSVIPPTQSITELPKSDNRLMTNNGNGLSCPKTDQKSYLHQATTSYLDNSTSLPSSNLLLNANSKNNISNSMDSFTRQSFSTNSNIQSSPPQYALDYISKIKARFIKKPEIFQQFLDILGHFQIQQTTTPDGTIESKKLHDEVYAGVSKLFKNETDLLQEFSQFLPDPPPVSVKQVEEIVDSDVSKQKRKKKPIASDPIQPKQPVSIPESIQPMKPTAEISSIQPVKLHKVFKDDELGDGLPIWFKNNNPYKIADDKVLLNRLFKTFNKRTFLHILRIISLYNISHLSKDDTLSLLHQIIYPHNDIYTSISNILELEGNHEITGSRESNASAIVSPNFQTFLSRTKFIDFTESRRIGASYWPFKKDYIQSKCSGKTKISEETINEKYISQPSLSEDTPYNFGKKSFAAEILQKIEQERYDMDMVLMSNRTAIAYLEEYLQLLNDDNRSSFSIDLSITKSSSFKQLMCHKSIQRIYGENCNIIFEGLKSSCFETLPLVISRLKLKDAEWVSSYQKINTVWLTEIKKYSLKALDHQGQVFKSNDIKNMRIKNLLKEITSITNVTSEDFLSNNFDRNKNMFPLTFASNKICLSALHFIYYAIKRLNAVSKSEKSKMYGFLNTFHCWIFSLKPDSSISKDDDMSIDSICAHFPIPSKYPLQIFTNTHIYIYLRLYHLLCSRLQQIEDIKVDSTNTKYYRNLSFNKKNASQNIPDAVINGQSTNTNTNTNTLNDNLKTDESQSQLQNMIYNLIDGNIDSEYFEEGCICMFGLDCYFLFTIDKIINGIVRELNTIVIDPKTLNLLNDLPVLMKKHFETMNKTELLRYWQSTCEDESCYLVYIHKMDDLILLNCKVLDIGIKQATETSQESASEDWIEYITQFTNIDSNKDLPNRSHNLFLHKNYINGKKLRKMQKILIKPKIQQTDSTMDKNNQVVKRSILDISKIIMNYKLESDIMVNSYKIRYVQQTRDILFVKGSLIKAKKYFKSNSYSNKTLRFKTWWADKLCYINNNSVH